ncbi:MAG: GNAT family N-acetyltransferase [Haloarculaceae archaeon]
MVTGYTIRRATTDDIEAIQRVARKSWRAAYADFMDEAVIEEMLSQGYSTGFLEEAIESPKLALFLAEVDRVVGYVSCEPPTESEVGQVSIYVSPDYWREGLGTALLDRATEYLATKGATALQDTVLADNEVGNAFYRTHFEQVEETTVEMGGEEYDAYVYQSDI